MHTDPARNSNKGWKLVSPVDAPPLSSSYRHYLIQCRIDEDSRENPLPSPCFFLRYWQARKKEQRFRHGFEESPPRVAKKNRGEEG